MAPVLILWVLITYLHIYLLIKSDVLEGFHAETESKTWTHEKKVKIFHTGTARYGTDAGCTNRAAPDKAKFHGSSFLVTCMRHTRRILSTRPTRTTFSH